MLRLKQWLRIVGAGSAFAGFGMGAVLLAWLVLPVLSISGSRAVRRRRCQRVVRASFVFFHDYMRRLGLVDFDPAALREPLPEGPLVLVTNHPTLVDVTAMIAAFGELCVVAKSSWFRNPLVGPLLRCCGHIDSGVRGASDGIALLDEGAARLAEGHRVLLFPEGTRSPAQGMRRFRSGAFHLAMRAGVPVLPVLITADPPGLKKHQPWYAIPNQPIRLRLHQLPLIAAASFATPRELQGEVRKCFDAAWAEHASPRPAPEEQVRVA